MLNSFLSILLLCGKPVLAEAILRAVFLPTFLGHCFAQLVTFHFRALFLFTAFRSSPFESMN